MKTLWLFGHQLTQQLAGFSHLSKSDDIILFVESTSRSNWLPYHKQKLVLIFSAMRHFAEELRQQGYRVDYRFADTFSAGFAMHRNDFPSDEIIIHWPTDWTMRKLLDRWASDLPDIRITPLEEDALFLVPRTEWPNYLSPTQSRWTMEPTYQKLRKRFNILMTDGKPLGGKWNYDTENRKRPNLSNSIINPLHFPPDDITRQVIDYVASNFPDHPGNISTFCWPVDRVQALEALHHFIHFRLPDFGEQQDAMIENQPFMAHSLLASAINIGLLHPLEVIQAAEKAYRDGLAPLSAVEGFIRQILGWREYVRGIYIINGAEYSSSNHLQHYKDLPSVYWSGKSELNCINQCVNEVLQNGYSHHIQRLMILGNFALLYGVQPKQVNNWFNQMYVDAFDWVVTPNVIGMSQHADGGKMATKPYVSSAQYIKKMSNYCTNCNLDPDEKIGEHACPFNSLYWAFIEKHKAIWQDNPRMKMIVAAWNKMPEQDRQQLLSKASKFQIKNDS